MVVEGEPVAVSPSPGSLPVPGLPLVLPYSGWVPIVLVYHTGGGLRATGIAASTLKGRGGPGYLDYTYWYSPPSPYGYTPSGGPPSVLPYSGAMGVAPLGGAVPRGR